MFSCFLRAKLDLRALGFVREWTSAEGCAGSARLSCQVLSAAGWGLTRRPRPQPRLQDAQASPEGQGWASGEQVRSLEHPALSLECQLGGLRWACALAFHGQPLVGSGPAQDVL